MDRFKMCFPWKMSGICCYVSLPKGIQQKKTHFVSWSQIWGLVQEVRFREEELIVSPYSPKAVCPLKAGILEIEVYTLQRTITYPTLRKGKSSSKLPFGREYVNYQEGI